MLSAHFFLLWSLAGQSLLPFDRGKHCSLCWSNVVARVHRWRLTWCITRISSPSRGYAERWLKQNIILSQLAYICLVVLLLWKEMVGRILPSYLLFLQKQTNVGMILNLPIWPFFSDIEASKAPSKKAWWVWWLLFFVFVDIWKFRIFVSGRFWEVCTFPCLLGLAVLAKINMVHISDPVTTMMFTYTISIQYLSNKT